MTTPKNGLYAKMDERMRKLENSLIAHNTRSEAEQKRQTEIMKSIFDVYKGIKNTLYGNGSEGMKIKVDRLEQTESNRKWTIRAMVVTILGILGGILTYLFTDK